MEEVDKIIIQSLTSIGCNLTPDIRSIGQLNQDMFVESVAKLLNTINPSTELPTKLPPNTGVKFRICTKFSNSCQQLGYKNEIGYQTFLYLNEQDMRNLLIFLVEKLTKEISSSGDQTSEPMIEKTKSLNNLIAQCVKSSLNKFWLPPYCKLNSLRIQEDNTFSKEGCKFVDYYNSVKLSIPYDLVDSKSQHYEETQSYLKKHCLYVSNQATRQAVDVLNSLIEMNINERLKEQMLLADLNSSEESSKADSNKIKMKELKDALRSSLKKANELIDETTDGNKSVLTNTDIADIETALELSPKQMNTKASRFAHSEKLQFTKEENNRNVSVITSSNEEKKEEEIKSLKENLENLNQTYENLESEFKKLNDSVSELEKNCTSQDEVNKKIQESILIKKKTVKLIEDAPKNIQRLKEEISGHDDKMAGLEKQWLNHKEPLELERQELQKQINDKKAKLQEKLDQMKSIRSEVETLNSELTSKENLIVELNRDLEKAAKSSSKSTNRQFYTKRILEIVANIDKQKKEINKVLIETKNIQKDINQLIGKLERIFSATDELIYKDARKDEMNKKVYKLFISINDSYEKLIQTIEESSHLERENRDLEDQVASETQNNVTDNMEMVKKDLKQIKEENESLMKNLKA